MQKPADRLDHRQVHPGDQQNRGAGDPRQHHGGNGHRAGQGQVRRVHYTQLCHVHRQQARASPQHGQTPHQRRAQQGEERQLPSAQRVLLRQCHKGDGRSSQPQKQAAHEVDIVGKQTRQQRHTQSHTGDPARSQLQKIGQRRFAGGAIPSEQVMEGVDEAVIKSQNERHRAAGHAGYAVRQRHTKAVKRRRNHTNTSCKKRFLLSWMLP